MTDRDVRDHDETDERAAPDSSGERPLVHIVDDEAAMRAFISHALQRAGYATEIYASGEELLEAIGRNSGEGCLLLDYRLPGMDGLEVLREIGSRCIDVAPIMMTGHGDVTTAVAAMKSGAVDFIEKPLRTESLLEKVGHAVALQQKARARAAQERRARAALAELAPRELEVVRGLLAGMSNKVIARHLALSPRTVEDHRLRAMRKLRASSTADAIRLAVRAGVEPLGAD